MPQFHFCRADARGYLCFFMSFWHWLLIPLPPHSGISTMAMRSLRGRVVEGQPAPTNLQEFLVNSDVLFSGECADHGHLAGQFGGSAETVKAVLQEALKEYFFDGTRAMNGEHTMRAGAKGCGLLEADVWNILWREGCRRCLLDKSDPLYLSANNVEFRTGVSRKSIATGMKNSTDGATAGDFQQRGAKPPLNDEEMAELKKNYSLAKALAGKNNDGYIEFTQKVDQARKVIAMRTGAKNSFYVPEPLSETAYRRLMAMVIPQRIKNATSTAERRGEALAGAQGLANLVSNLATGMSVLRITADHPNGEVLPGLIGNMDGSACELNGESHKTVGTVDGAKQALRKQRRSISTPIIGGQKRSVKYAALTTADGALEGWVTTLKQRECQQLSFIYLGCQGGVQQALIIMPAQTKKQAARVKAQAKEALRQQNQQQQGEEEEQHEEGGDEEETSSSSSTLKGHGENCKKRRGNGPATQAPAEEEAEDDDFDLEFENDENEALIVTVEELEIVASAGDPAKMSFGANFAAHIPPGYVNTVVLNGLVVQFFLKLMDDKRRALREEMKALKTLTTTNVGQSSTLGKVVREEINGIRQLDGVDRESPDIERLKSLRVEDITHHLQQLQPEAHGKKKATGSKDHLCQELTQLLLEKKRESQPQTMSHTHPGSKDSQLLSLSSTFAGKSSNGGSSSSSGSSSGSGSSSSSLNSSSSTASSSSSNGAKPRLHQYIPSEQEMDERKKKHQLRIEMLLGLQAKHQAIAPKLIDDDDKKTHATIAQQIQTLINGANVLHSLPCEQLERELDELIPMVLTLDGEHGPLAAISAMGKVLDDTNTRIWKHAAKCSMWQQSNDLQTGFMTTRVLLQTPVSIDQQETDETKWPVWIQYVNTTLKKAGVDAASRHTLIQHYYRRLTDVLFTAYKPPTVRKGYELGSIHPWNPRKLAAGVPGFVELEDDKAVAILDGAEDLGRESWVTQMCTDDHIWAKLGHLIGERDSSIDLTSKPLNYQRALGVLGTGARQHNFDLDVHKLQGTSAAFYKKVQSTFAKVQKLKMAEQEQRVHPKIKGPPLPSALDDHGAYYCAKGVTGCDHMYTSGDARGEDWFRCCYCEDLSFCPSAACQKILGKHMLLCSVIKSDGDAPASSSSSSLSSSSSSSSSSSAASTKGGRETSKGGEDKAKGKGKRKG